jgi:CO/xanthine dehydrogenase FAD-binding subunit
MQIQEYVKPASIAEAYSLLQARPDAVVFGGGAMLRLGRRQIGLAVDLFEAGLDFVQHAGDRLELGAMVCFRRLETDPLLQDFAGGVLPEAVRNIVGVQQRNLFSVGGTVHGKYGFSNLLTVLLALDATVVFHGAGPVPLAVHLAGGGRRRDIVEKIVLPAGEVRASYQMVTRTRSDFALLNVAVARRQGVFRVAVGARPRVATLARQAMALLDGQAEQDAATHAGTLAAAELSFGSDLRASADYRRRICRVLVRRAVEDVLA